jgi:DNA-binding NtrC family response regulator
MELHNKLHNLETQITEVHSFENIIGNSAPMKIVFDLIEKVANNDIPVLIQGESGTGKELVAKAIHNHGNRKKAKFVDVNCAAFPESLLESELFGHEKGAFTDAKSKHIGKFEQAGQGTLFLDEIGEMPISIQAKILRVLQEKTIVRVGGSESIPINCRIITATNRILKKELNAGNFREDLFYRISVFPINLPTLRERFEDILLLAPHFVNKYSDKNNPKNIPVKVMKTFLNYRWPGNVRELENTIYRAVILAGDNEISMENLPPEIRFKRSADCNNKLQEFLGEKIIPFETIEQEVYKHALQMEKGNVSSAAKKLGIGRTTFYRKLKKYNLSE